MTRQTLGRINLGDSRHIKTGCLPRGVDMLYTYVQAPAAERYAHALQGIGHTPNQVRSDIRDLDKIIHCEGQFIGDQRVLKSAGADRRGGSRCDAATAA